MSDSSLTTHLTGISAVAGFRACRGLFVLAIALLVAICALPASAQQPKRMLVGFRDTMQTSSLAKLQRDTGARPTKLLAGGRVLVMDLAANETPASFKSKALMSPSVAFVEPDGMMYPTLVPNDPEYGQQYHLELIRAPEAWDVTTGSRNVTIAVVDTGVDLDHPDLVGRIFRNTGEIPGNGIDDDGNGFIDDVNGWDFQNGTNDPNPEPDGVDNDGNGTPDDQVSHGTLVAGLAAATGNDGWGTAGIDWNVKILPIQVFPDDGGASVSQVIDGIDYAVLMGADIINLSVGGGYYESFTPAIERANNAGILVVAAAGNSGQQFTDFSTSWESPVCNDGENLGVDNWVLGVGSTDRNDLRASFSNYDGSSTRNFVECMAPGEGIYGIGFYQPGFPAFSSYFTTNSGTSFSAPQASGLAALLLAQNPARTPAQLIAAIRNGCDSIDSLNPGFAGKLGAGRINCARSLGVPLAPRLPQDVAAADTPDDQGGSITITWRTSPDDGAGAESVTAYIILRSRTATDSFSEVGTVGPGATSFVDTSVSDGLAYYYMVRVTDGSLSADTDVVGPVRSSNDSAPARVTGVYTEDRPADDGGAIVVGWNRYVAPPDFSHFAIYRARARFSNVAAMTPIAQVDSSAAVDHVDTTVTDGVDYYYAVVAVDTFDNSIADPTVVGPVQSFANGSMTLAAGMYFLGSPLEPSDGDPATLLGVQSAQIRVARWNAARRDYDLYSGPGTLPVAVGRGYWLKLEETLTFSPVGNLAPAGSLNVELTPGWQQIGNPYFGNMNLANVTVDYQGTTMDLASASAAGIIQQIFWRYNRADNSYNMIAPMLGVGDSIIPPWEGCWARVEKGCSLILPRPDTAASAPAASVAEGGLEGAGDWVARLAARGVGGTDSDNFFGVSQRLSEMGPLHSPPPTANGVDLFFSNGTGSRLAGDLAATGAGAAEWNLMVEGLPGSPVEVWCPDPTSIPQGWTATLVDSVTGATTDIRRGARYTTALREGETLRPMSLRLTRTGGVLTLSSLSAQATRAGGAQMTFTLSAPADCTVSVLNIAGRTVRVLERGVSRPAGSSQTVWDGRSDAGLAVPNGMYLMQVEAVSEGGSRTQAVRTLAIQR